MSALVAGVEMAVEAAEAAEADEVTEVAEASTEADGLALSVALVTGVASAVFATDVASRVVTVLVEEVASEAGPEFEGNDNVCSVLTALVEAPREDASREEAASAA